MQINNAWVILFLIACFITQLWECQSTNVSNYLFTSSAFTGSFADSYSNYPCPLIYMADHYTGNTINNPELTVQGAHFTKNTYLQFASTIPSITNVYISTGIWIFYRTGTPGNFWRTVLEGSGTGPMWATVFAEPTAGTMKVKLNMDGGSNFTLGTLVQGWNYVAFSLKNNGFDITENIRSRVCNLDSWNPEIDFNYTLNSNGCTGVQYIGCYDCTDSAADYVIYSFKNMRFHYLTNVSNIDTSTNITYNQYWYCGDHNRDSFESWDDGNIINGDGCSEFWEIESGWTCNYVGSNIADVCACPCGNGVRDSGELCDDGNTVDLDGWTLWAVDPGFTCTGGSASTPDTCSETWGDGKLYSSISTKWDDGNTANGDGCSSTWNVETGWSCKNGSPTTPSSWTVIWGDGILKTPVEECDDGNSVSNDGWSNICKLESGFSCSTVASNIPATLCDDLCGDGKRYSSAGCDDGNTINGDGWSSSCIVESGYTCIGGSPTTSDSWSIVCGDGVNPGTDSTKWDDGNLINGDGCSSSCTVEFGFTCSSAFNSISIWTEQCGKGFNFGTVACDDGNLINGDGCSSTCTVEPGFSWFGGSHTKKDVCSEAWGDGKNQGGYEWDDGNFINSDGCDDEWNFEKCYMCTGGDSINPDVWTYYVINATLASIGSGNNLVFTFDAPINSTSIGLSDISVEVDAKAFISTTWYAVYIDDYTLKLSITYGSMLRGKEVLNVNFLNYKTFRGPNGGWVSPTSFSASLSSSLAGSAKSARSIGNFTAYFVFLGILALFGVVILCGQSIEILWSLINTLQLITYLTLMIGYYPDHVKIMFQLLQFVNLDISYISSMFSRLTSIDGIQAPSYNSRFLENGIDSPLFLQNWASLLMSLILTLSFLGLLCLMYFLLCWSWIKLKIKKIISSYFFNNIIRFSTEGYLEITFGVILNIAAFPRKSMPELVSLILSWVSWVPLIIFPFMAATLLYDKRKEIANGNEKYLKRFGTIYADFKLDHEWYWFQYYPLFLLRRLIFVVFLICLLNYTEVQCNCFLLTSLMTFMFQALCKPFHDELINVLWSINEAILFSVSSIQMVFIVKMDDIRVIEMTGWVMISLVMGMIMINFWVSFRILKSLIFFRSLWLKACITNEKSEELRNHQKKDM